MNKKSETYSVPPEFSSLLWSKDPGGSFKFNLFFDIMVIKKKSLSVQNCNLNSNGYFSNVKHMVTIYKLTVVHLFRPLD